MKAEKREKKKKRKASKYPVSGRSVFTLLDIILRKGENKKKGL